MLILRRFPHYTLIFGAGIRTYVDVDGKCRVFVHIERVDAEWAVLPIKVGSLWRNGRAATALLWEAGTMLNEVDTSGNSRHLNCT